MGALSEEDAVADDRAPAERIPPQEMLALFSGINVAGKLLVHRLFA